MVSMVYKLGTSYGCHLNLKITLTDELYDFKQSLKDLFNSYPTKKKKPQSINNPLLHCLNLIDIENP